MDGDTELVSTEIPKMLAEVAAEIVNRASCPTNLEAGAALGAEEDSHQKRHQQTSSGTPAGP